MKKKQIEILCDEVEKEIAEMYENAKPATATYADELLLAVYREMWKDAICTGSHGLRTNITEYLTSKNLLK